MDIKSIIILLIVALSISFASCKKKEDKTPESSQQPVPTTPSNLPTLATSSVSSISAVSAICGGTILTEGTSAITAVGVCWDINPSPTTLKPHTNDGAGVGNYTSTINGLTASTVYYVRAYATNASGTIYGNEYSFTTQSMWAAITPTNNYFFASFIYTKGTKLFAISSNTILASMDNGVNWAPSSAGITSGGIQCIADDGTNIFAGGQGLFFISNDNGANWTAKNNGLFASNVTAIKSGTMGIFSGTDNGVFLTTNNGNNWMAAGLTGVSITEMLIKGSTVFAGTAGGGLYSSTNNGSTWTACNSGISGTYIFNLVISGNNIIASTEIGNFISINNGVSWTTIGGGLPQTGGADFSANGNNILANFNSQSLYFSSDNGVSWAGFNTGIPTGFNLGAIHINGNDAFTRCNNDYRLYRRKL